jgi:signal transduction histidine kinase
MDRRSEALAQLLETALSERFAAPVVELLNALPIPLAVVHAGDRRLVAANEAMAALLDRPQEEILGSRLSDLLPPIHPLADPHPFSEVGAGGPATDTPVTIRGEPWRWFVRSLKGGEEGVDYLLTGLVGTVRQGDEAIAWLREANAAKTDFLKMAAHELRTPLGVIHGYGSLLAQGELSAENQRLAGQRIYEKARQLSRLITDMTLLARFDELGPELTRAPVDLKGLVEQQVDEVRRRYPDLAVELALEPEASTVQGNADWLQVAVRELLDNAARFRRLPTGRIDVSLGGAADGVCSLTVIDDGFGIEEQEQGRLFRRFSRLETEENHHLVGLGIGLYLVLEIARAHGGSIDLRSRPGQGSEFRLTLPPA